MKSNWGVNQTIESRQEEKVAGPESAGRENLSVKTSQDLHTSSERVASKAHLIGE